jgi:UDP-perosamine 4-acetyltransferase
MSRPIVIVGAGGHARVLADALIVSGAVVVGFVDSNPSLRGGTALSLPVLGDDTWLDRPEYAECALVNGIGGVGDARGASPRRIVQERLEERGRTFVGVHHPQATVSRFAMIGDAVQLLARCVVQSGCEIGKGCIVNTGAIVEHDCRIGAFTHCAPGSLICGDVSVGENSYVGAGAVVRQGVCLEGATVVGAGAVVLRSFAGRGPLVGVPAKDRGTG